MLRMIHLVKKFINNGVKCIYIAKTNAGTNKTHDINK